MNHIDLKQKQVYIYRNDQGEEWKTNKPIEDLTDMKLVHTYTEYGAAEESE